MTTVGFTAGLELRVPTGNHGLLRPYADFGGVVNAQDRSLITTLFGAGLLAEFVFWHDALEFGFEPRLEFAASRSTRRSFEEEYTAVFLKAGVRHPLWFKDGRYLPSFGLYTQGGYYLDGIDLGVVGHSNLSDSSNQCRIPRLFSRPGLADNVQ